MEFVKKKSICKILSFPHPPRKNENLTCHSVRTASVLWRELSIVKPIDLVDEQVERQAASANMSFAFQILVTIFFMVASLYFYYLSVIFGLLHWFKGALRRSLKPEVNERLRFVSLSMRLCFLFFLYFTLGIGYVPRCKESKINHNQPKNSSFQRIRCEYWVGFDILL